MQAWIRKYIVIIIFLFLVGILAAKFLGLGTSPQITDKSATGPDLSTQLKEAQGHPTWLLFRSETCAPCIEMQRVFDQLQPEYQERVKFISIDVNEPTNRDLVKQYQITYIPATFLLDAQGNLYYQQIGAIPISMMRTHLNRLLEVN